MRYAKMPRAPARSAKLALMAQPLADESCANIGARERRMRLWLGIGQLIVAAGVLVSLVASGAPRGYRALLVVLWGLGALGIFQAQQRTCVALAARGERSLEGVVEPLPDRERAAIRRQATSVYIRSFLTAAALTLVSLLVF